jgi:hypothetical protein
MRILLLLVPALIIGLASCKKCYECTKTNTNINGILDSTVAYKFDACNTAKENNGINNGRTIADYEANGYKCELKK